MKRGSALEGLCECVPLCELACVQVRVACAHVCALLPVREQLHARLCMHARAPAHACVLVRLHVCSLRVCACTYVSARACVRTPMQMWVRACI